MQIIFVKETGKGKNAPKMRTISQPKMAIYPISLLLGAARPLPH
jgi:hypothetical protein